MGRERVGLMRARPLGLAAIAAIAASATCRAAAADDADWVGFYGRLRDYTVQSRAELYEKLKLLDKQKIQSRRQQRMYQTAVRPPSIETASNATAIDVAQAAIRSSMDGTVAGASVALPALLGFGDFPLQVVVGLAALDQSKTRYQLAASWERLRNYTSPSDLGLAACTFGDKEKKDLLEQIDALSAAYRQACEIVAHILKTPNHRVPKRSTDGRYAAACGLQRGDDSLETLPQRVDELNKLFDEETKRREEAAKSNKSEDAQSLAELQGRLEGMAPSIEKLTAFELPKLDVCHDSDAIRDAATRKAWEDRHLRFGLAARADIYPHVFGFNPTPTTPLANGQTAEAEVNFDFSYVKGRVEITAGCGYGKAREDLSQPLRPYLSPSLSVAWVVGSLSHDTLMDPDTGKVRLVDGALPPRLVVGLDGSLQWALDPPDTQDGNVNKLTVTAFLDFRFTESLAVRVGAPLSGVIVVRPADASVSPPVTERRGLQWTIPVFVGSVLKL